MKEEHLVNNDAAIRGAMPHCVPLCRSLLYLALSLTVCLICLYLTCRGYEPEPQQTFIFSFIAGILGTVICGCWLLKISGGRAAFALILLAYILRVAIGSFLYVHYKDPDYFHGSGEFNEQNWEYMWTYETASKAADAIEYEGKWNPHTILTRAEDKNRIIHTWMGLFLAATGNRHALTVSVVNSYHHVIAGILLVAILISLGYSNRSALWSGIMLAWIPWAFDSMTMWRDSVGLCFIVLSSLFVFLSITKKPWSLIFLVPAGYLAYADREIYLLVVVLIFAILVWRQIRYFDNTAIAKVIGVSFLIFLIVLATYINYSFIFARHEHFLSLIGRRFLYLPLMLVRAIMGPFPWVNALPLFRSNVVVWDLMFHVMQLSLLWILLMKWKRIHVFYNPLFLLFIAYWLIGCLGGGVHTAYLAVASPYLIGLVSGIKKGIKLELYVSFMFFLVSNALYLLAGLHGEGSILRVTGY